MSHQSLVFVFLIITAVYSISLECEVENCDLCKEDSKSICVNCKSNFVLLNGSCPCRENACETCVSSYYGGCRKCKEGFEIDNGYCNCKLIGCLYCNDNGCDQCLPKYKLENSRCISDLSTVISCYDPNCQYCNSNKEGGCSQCNSDYNLEAGKCNKNPECLNSTVQGACIECPNEYYPSSGFCLKKCLGQPCIKEVCDNKCLICNNYKLFQFSNCHPINYCNDLNCENCFSNKVGDCFRCKLGHRLFEGKCSQCEGINCLACDYDATKCSSCNEGYYLVDDECISKSNEIAIGCDVPNCQTCLIDGYCKKCSDASYSMSNGRCVQCNIDNCKECIDDGKCFSCNANYLVQNGNCIAKVCPINHCLSCSNTMQCTKCEDGYEVKFNKCQIKKCEASHCTQCHYDTKTCTECDYHYYLTEEMLCEGCNVENCFVCSKDKCAACIENYYLSVEGQCKYLKKPNDIIPNCVLYNNNGLCGKCESSCTLTKEGLCKCIPISSIIVGLLFSAVLIAAIVICFLFSRKRKELRELQRQNEIDRENQLLEQRVLEMQKIPEEEVIQIIKNDSDIPKCILCNIERGVIQLSCGCLLCLDQGKQYLSDDSTLKERKEDDNEDKEIAKDNSNEAKSTLMCPKCQSIVTSSKQLFSQCGICLEATTKPYHFNCNCAMKACAKCYNKCIETKKCPGCRKDLIHQSFTNCENNNIILLNNGLMVPGRVHETERDPNSQLPLQIVEHI